MQCPLVSWDRSDATASKISQMDESNKDALWKWLKWHSLGSDGHKWQEGTLIFNLPHHLDPSRIWLTDGCDFLEAPEMTGMARCLAHLMKRLIVRSGMMRISIFYGSEFSNRSAGPLNVGYPTLICVRCYFVSRTKLSDIIPRTRL